MAALNLDVSQGTAVLKLLESARIPPQPTFYRLLFDYVSGVEGLFSARVRDILTDTPKARERLYAEFVAPYERSEAIEETIDRITSRLRAVETLIVESSTAARAHSVSLGAAAEGLAAAAVNARLVREFVTHVQATNLNLFRANSKLVSELNAAQAELDDTRDQMAIYRENARLDPLTGLSNRHGLDVAFARLLETREVRTLSCAVIDVDHFKTLNDGYGHPVGDAVLRVVARSLLATARASDIVGRTGGDEFVVILPGAGLSAAHNVAEELRMAVADADLKGTLGPDVLGGMTVSIGVSEYIEDEGLANFIGRADDALYRAKASGRNRVECEPPRQPG